LVSRDNTDATMHKDKLLILWKVFKLRLGSSEFTGFIVEPTLFIQRAEDSYLLQDPFTHKEIDDVIKVFPSDKSLRPDGFNNEF